MDKAAIYLRVSSDEQVKGFGLDIQNEKARAACNLHDFELNEKHVFRDEGVSGAERNRPELNRMLTCAKNKEFSVIFVYKIDRLSRKLLDLLEITNGLEQLGVGLRSVTEPIDTTTSIGRCIFQILGSFAEFERGVIRERTYGGQIQNKKAGNWVSGMPAYGYNYDKSSKKLVINDEEARYVRKMFNWYVKDKISLHDIQNRLNDIGVPTKFDNVGRSKSVNGKGFWRRRTIGRIIANEVYTGDFTYNKYEYPGRSKAQGVFRPESEWIAVKTPKIISKEVFRLAQEQLKSNKKYAPRNAKRDYLLSGLLECGQCTGCYICAFESWRKVPEDRQKRYICNNTRKHVKQVPCTASSITEDKLALPIWEKVSELLQNPDIALAQMEKIQERGRGKVEIEDENKQVITLLSKNQEKQTRLLDVYLDGDRKLGKEEFLVKKEILESERKRLVEEKNRYESQLNAPEEKTIRSKAILSMYEKLKINLKNINYEQKREVLKMLVSKVLVTGKKLDIHCIIPYELAFEGHSTHRCFSLHSPILRL